MQAAACFPVCMLLLITVTAFSSERQESLALASMAQDDPPTSSMAAAMCGKVGWEFET